MLKSLFKNPLPFERKLVCDDCTCELEIDKLEYRMIGMKCPYCGTNMLSHGEYFRSKRVELRLWLMNATGRFDPDKPFSVHVQRDNPTAFVSLSEDDAALRRARGVSK